MSPPVRQAGAGPPDHGREKTDVSLLLTPVIQVLGSSHPISPRKNRGWFDPTQTRGRGLGVYEPVPDRTVSGNAGKFVGHWGMSADKKGRNVAKHHQFQQGALQK
ncbi:hypothetical protein ACVDG5_026475 [Mesorhizobium sp. ORM6]